MNRTLWILAGFLAIGLFVLILPDKGNPIIRFNKIHGPSLTDLIGLSLILISWLVSCIMIIIRWKSLAEKIGNRSIYFLTSLYFFFLFGIALALILFLEWMLWLCVAIASLINILFIVSAFRAK
ncbi:MAG TPA: hypothetical protein VI461_16410 [Chitinophagaceae bacterium]|nr:hypothetical protein [Chitinophagaceae bacterium]